MTKRKSRNHFYLYFILALAALGLAALLSHAARDSGRLAEESLPPELQFAAGIEQGIQDEPEEVPAPGALRIPILIYHSIRPYSPTDSDSLKAYEITPETFEKQLKYLQDNGYTAVSLDQVAYDLKIGFTGSLKPVVLTFDDGWANQYKYAFPLLKKYGMKGTFYVYTRPIDSKHFLTWDNLKEMAAAGMDIEDHSHTHPFFKGLALDQAAYEVSYSKHILETELKKSVKHFASPFGYSNGDLINVVKNAGYDTFRTTYKGIYQDNPLRLRGTLVTNSFDYFVQELNQGR